MFEIRKFQQIAGKLFLLEFFVQSQKQFKETRHRADTDLQILLHFLEADSKDRLGIGKIFLLLLGADFVIVIDQIKERHEIRRHQVDKIVMIYTLVTSFTADFSRHGYAIEFPAGFAYPLEVFYGRPGDIAQNFNKPSGMLHQLLLFLNAGAFFS